MHFKGLNFDNFLGAMPQISFLGRATAPYFGPGPNPHSETSGFASEASR